MSLIIIRVDLVTHIPFFSVVAPSKDVYQLRFYNIQAADEEEEE